MFNHTVKKICDYSYFLLKLTLLRTSAAQRRLGHMAIVWLLRWGHEALPREFDHFLFYLELFYSKFIVCSYCAFNYITHNHEPPTQALLS